MATKPSSSSSPGLLKLEEQLTCPVCLEHYTNPKTLPCLHSFCEHCLEGLPLDMQNETYHLSCPTCRHRTELPEEGAGAFPVAFHLNNLKEIHSLMKKVANPQQVTCDNCTTANATGYCKDCSKFLCAECDGVHKKWGPTASHQLTSLDEVTVSVSSTSQLKQEATLMCSTHNKKMKLYCETCDSVMCHNCTFDTHKGHEYNFVSVSYHKLEGYLNPVKRKIETLKRVMSALTEREGEIRERGEGVLEEIHEMVEEMVNVLRQSERKLTEQAKRVTDAKLKVLSEQMKSAEMSLSLLKDVEDYVEQSLKTGSPQQVLRSKKQMMERMSEVTAQVSLEELHPKEKADFVLSKDIKSLHHIGDIVSGTTALDQNRVKKTMEKFEQFTTDDNGKVKKHSEQRSTPSFPISKTGSSQSKTLAAYKESSGIPPFNSRFHHTPLLTIHRLIGSKNEHHDRIVHLEGYLGHHKDIMQHRDKFHTFLFSSFNGRNLEYPYIHVFFTKEHWNVSVYPDPLSLPSEGGVQVEIWGIVKCRLFKDSKKYRHSLQALYYKRIEFRTTSSSRETVYSQSAGMRKGSFFKVPVPIISKPTTTPPCSLAEYIREELKDKPCGLWGKVLAKKYSEVFKEDPSNILDRIKKLPFVKVVSAVEGNPIILINKKVEQL